MTTISTAAFAILASNNENESSMKTFYIACLLVINTVFYSGWIYNFARLQYKIIKESEFLIKIYKSYKRKAERKHKFIIIKNESN